VIDFIALGLGFALVVPLTLVAASAVEAVGHARLSAKYKDAFQRGDIQEVMRLRALMRAARPEGEMTVEFEKVGDGEVLLLHERWADARDTLARVDRSILPVENRPGVLSNLAYATAHAGEPEQAIELVRRALGEAAALGSHYPAEKLPFLRGAHGIALGLAGRHEDAIAWLEPLVAIEHPKRARATRAYYLALSYRALGRYADAARAFAIAAEGEGPFADRARLAAARLHPHRS
jgi:tetratricopeptide (TPR) repeat protein